MATITSTASGVWSATSTWAGGVLPAITDVAKLAHVVTLDVATQIQGFDPTGTGMLKASPSGSFAVLCGGLTLAYRVTPLQGI